MIEKNIFLGNIDPVSFYGVANENLNLLQNAFPKIKLVARGNELLIKGEQEKLHQFEITLEQLFDHYHKHNLLTLKDITSILDKGTSNKAEGGSDILLYGNNGKMIRAKTKNQKKLIELCDKNDLVFAQGPAGSGKTYMAIAIAVSALRSKQVKRIILTRPAVEAGENLGFLPGDLKEKLDPYLQPLYDALIDMIPPRRLADYLETGTIHIAPLAYMRGRTLSDAFVILDEAQNSTTSQMKMFLTRMGLNAKVIITGDASQIDLPRKQQSGLIQATHLLKDVKGIGHLTFDKSDIVRHPLVQKIVEVYAKHDEMNSK
ncbi:phosphate starvation-inducible protein PhoH [Balneicella halophila]|uniref:PhoH-like protein n=1 Tax=Balneicella halophila TaxID=1537566 RepID=A0A7L4US44_BALHA|nr:PhoH family protein [Balneicella halophila]PVX52302.1 phosphate starvation-inducible protein PhoH [Balneicella halophila]